MSAQRSRARSAAELSPESVMPMPVSVPGGASVRPGASIAAVTLANMVLVQILRQHLASGTNAPGWLSALADPKIGAALGCIHADVSRRWKVEELASAVAMSRTTFTERFKALVGMPPLKYPTGCCIALASAALREGKSLSSIAEQRPGFWVSLYLSHVVAEP